MFCGKCGKEINSESGLCENCSNTAVTSVQPQTKKQNSLAGEQENTSAYYTQEIPHIAPEKYSDEKPDPAPGKSVPSTYVPMDRYPGRVGTSGPIPSYGTMPPYPPVRRTKRRNNLQIVLYVILGLVVALFITLMAFVVMGGQGSLFGGDSQGAASSESGSLVLNVDSSHFTQTRTGSYILKGSVLVKQNKATLKLDGKIIEIFEPYDEEQQWYYSVSIDRGDNTFELVLDDDRNEPAREIINITNLMYEKGTVLVKYEKGRDEGINIRETASSARGVTIVGEIGPYEYSKELICQGEEKIGTDGFVWIKVSLPWKNNAVGWVRENIVREKS